MIVHCYLYRLREGSDLDQAAQKLRSMQAEIPEILEMEVGVDFSGAQNAYDLVQLTRFRTMEDYASFSKHPYHRKVREYFAQVALHAVKVDYTIA